MTIDTQEALRLLDRLRHYAGNEDTVDWDGFDAAYQQLRALLSAQEDGWRPIETAPRDGRTIILSRQTSFLGFWDSTQKAWCDNRQFFRDPTHWMPLPAPPGELAKQEAK